jgi:hypothetical protein
MLNYLDRIKLWPYRLTVRTEAFQASNRGSIPRRVTKIMRRMRKHSPIVFL